MKTLCILLILTSSVFAEHDSTLVLDTTRINDWAIFGSATGLVDHIGGGCPACRHDLVFSSSSWMFLALDTGFIDDSIGAVSSFDSVTINFEVIGSGGGDTAYFYPVFKPANVDSCTYNDWDSPDLEWGTAGANSTNDAGSYNTTDGGGDDRYATAQAEVDVTGVGSYRVSLPGAVAQDIYDVAITAIMIRVGDGANFRFAVTENSTAGDRPYFTFYYQTGAAPATPLTRRRRINQGG